MINDTEHKLYNFSPKKPIDLYKIERTSKNEYEISGNGEGKIYIRNIDNNVLTEVNHNFENGNYILSHLSGERFEVSSDGVNFINAWGIYLNGRDAYLEALSLSEYFLDESGKIYRKLEFNSISQSSITVWSNTTQTSSTRLKTDNLVDYNRSGYYLRYWQRPVIETNVKVGDCNLIELKNETLKIDGVPKGTIVPKDTTPDAYSHRFRIGFQFHATYYKWWETILWNIELGIHKAEMNGSGNGLYDKNGIQFMNLKGSTNWVKV